MLIEDLVYSELKKKKNVFVFQVPKPHVNREPDVFTIKLKKKPFVF